MHHQEVLVVGLKQITTLLDRRVAQQHPLTLHFDEVENCLLIYLSWHFRWPFGLCILSTGKHDSGGQNTNYW